MNAHAAYLKSKHDAWMTEFRAMRPDNDPSQFSSEAPPVPARPTYQDRVTRATPGDDVTRLVTDPGFHRSQMMIGRLMMVARTLDSRMTVPRVRRPGYASGGVSMIRQVASYFSWRRCRTRLNNRMWNPTQGVEAAHVDRAK